MDFEPSDRIVELRDRVEDFFDQEILPRNHEWIDAVEGQGVIWPGFLDELRAKAKSQGLWNMALPMLRQDDPGTRLGNLEFSHIAEIMGRLPWASYVFNCHAPDVPNMEILHMFGTDEQKARWLCPLLEGEIRSSFAMTEPNVASSDATNIATRIESDGDHYVINGHKWFATNAGNPNCKFTLIMGVTDPGAARGKGHSIVIVPNNTPGFSVPKNHSVFGHFDRVTPHSEIILDNVRVRKSNLIGSEGAGFLIGQARLGSARIHHCMRAIGQCEVLLRLMIERARLRKAFGRTIQSYSTVQEWVAESRLELEQSRLLVQKTAWMLDKVGTKRARKEISLIKIGVARTFYNIANRAIQVFGAMGVTDDGPFAAALGQARAFRIYDGPDEVHHRTVFRLEEAESLGAAPLSPHYLRGAGYVQAAATQLNS